MFTVNLCVGLVSCTVADVESRPTTTPKGIDAATPLPDGVTPQPKPEPASCSCAGKICGAPDGCGGLCAGSNRNRILRDFDRRGDFQWHDCRIGGKSSDCGCGVESDNGNMICEDAGTCQIQCPVDCRHYYGQPPSALVGYVQGCEPSDESKIWCRVKWAQEGVCSSSPPVVCNQDR